ncbi:hypothetical protein [Enterococcus gilvus]|uniref:Uncharacterized protein n=1 Tax=Enterococcus gilvus ATCC BAA-350 TaxID=1158614 RepID=R2VD16_9ENTE|nr:hypothetical protein [Enterococcus gilvus]EOI55615.1 hypothetical protein UKC_02824 [Enterococcus gilvus ATCC BAA-350]EOW81842.1 hypothetical protein I592_01142 [Enterococcus gilvus ATCC BAA-350]
MSNREKIYPFPTNEKIDVEFPMARSKSNDDGGGGDMSNYVTKEEFNEVIKDLTHQIELNQVTLLSKFESVNNKIDSISETIPDKLQIALNEQSKEDRKDAVETRRYIIGTIVIGLLSLAISLFT